MFYFMKKIVYLCTLVLLSLNVMAQIDLNDRNWERVFYDDFSANERSWSNWISYPDKIWQAYTEDGITHGDEHQVYQYSNCVFDDTFNTLNLIAEFDINNNIANNNYALPGNMGNNYPTHQELLYFSGEIESHDKTTAKMQQRFRYGYFEIHCKLPTHHGAFPAFWLYYSSTSESYYEEIDIFEYSWWITDPNGPNHNSPGLGSKRCFSTGLYFNNTANMSVSCARKYPVIPSNSSNLDYFHTYSCEWMPDHVLWYFDQELVNEFYKTDSIPSHHLSLIINYAIDNYYNHNNNTWIGPDDMVIDYINVYQLKWDCYTDEVIEKQYDLDNFYFAVKNSINISSSVSETIVRNTDKITFRATDSFEITGPFHTENGCEFTVLLQSCCDD